MIKERIMKVLPLILLAAAVSFAGQYSNDKMKKVVDALKTEQYDKAIDVVVDSSAFIKDNINVNTLKTQYINVFRVLNSQNGKPFSFEILQIKTMGSIEKTAYLVNCEKNAWVFVLTEYNNTQDKKQSIVNFSMEASQDDAITKYSK